LIMLRAKANLPGDLILTFSARFFFNIKGS